MKNLSISLLNCEDIPSFLEKIDKYKNEHIKQEQIHITVHFDVMDKVFVPNDGIDIEKIKIVANKGYYVDTHLMCEYPKEDGYIDKAYMLGSKNITIHIESKGFDTGLAYLKELKKKDKDIKIGIAIKPDTKPEKVEKYIKEIDKVLVMSVEPGYGKQKYIESANEKIKYLKEKYKGKIFVQVDGGVNDETIGKPAEMECDSFVVGSYLTVHEEELEDRIDRLSILAQIHSIKPEGDIYFQKRTLQIVPGGYGENDFLLGIKVPRLRKIEKVWYNTLSRANFEWLLHSRIHEYRAISCYMLAHKANKSNAKEIKSIIDDNIECINNWDLTDTLVPKAIGKQLIDESDEKIYKILRHYTKNKDIWIRRIGIVSLMYLAKAARKEVVLKVIDDNFFDTFHLTQKANGWMLRELYKTCPKETLEYLKQKNKINKLPGILKSYATEKMPKEQKQELK